MLYLDRPFWREEPFNEDELRLLDVLFEAHDKSSYRDNPSSIAALNAANASSELEKAYAAALMTLGGMHGPVAVVGALLLMDNRTKVVSEMLDRGSRIPGWGSSFAKDKPDPLWEEMDKQLRLVRPEMWSKLAEITGIIQSRGKMVFPNPSAYTAAVGIEIGLRPALMLYLFVAARLTAWTHLAGRVL